MLSDVKSKGFKRVLAAFTAGLLLTTVSELGDKTFFIAVILAMRHSRQIVFSAAMTALAVMTLMSIFIGQIIAFLPRYYIHAAEIALFLGFGLKLLYSAYQMPRRSHAAGAEEATVAVQSSQGSSSLHQRWFDYPQLSIWLQVFCLTFLAEWGDRTQISTITLASSSNVLGITIGTILGHSICSAIAVLGGQFIANRISERMMTAIGGVLFLIFGGVAGVVGP